MSTVLPERSPRGVGTLQGMPVLPKIATDRHTTRRKETTSQRASYTREKPKNYITTPSSSRRLTIGWSTRDAGTERGASHTEGEQRQAGEQIRPKETSVYRALGKMEQDKGTNGARCHTRYQLQAAESFVGMRTGELGSRWDSGGLFGRARRVTVGTERNSR